MGVAPAGTVVVVALSEESFPVGWQVDTSVHARPAHLRIAELHVRWSARPSPPVGDTATFRMNQ
jgi:hypothetical protein